MPKSLFSIILICIVAFGLFFTILDIPGVAQSTGTGSIAAPQFSIPAVASEIFVNDTTLIERAAQIVAKRSFAWYFAGFILAFALIFWAWFSIKIRGIRKQLETYRQKVGSLSEPVSLDIVGNCLAASKELTEVFRLFSNTALIELDDGKVKRLFRTDSAENHFDEEAILHSRINVDFWRSFPNFLTGAGIMGTFIGLVAGIHLAHTGLVSDSDEEIKQALAYLLSGASVAFLTSIAGLFSSIVFSVMKKASLYRVETSIALFAEALDRKIECISNERLLKGIEITITTEAGELKKNLDLMPAIQKELSKHTTELGEQTGQLKLFNTDLAMSIAEALDEKVSGRLTPALDKLLLAVEGLRKERSSENGAMISNMIREFQNNLSGAAGKEFEQLSGTISSLSDSLQGLISRFEEQQGKSLETTTNAARYILRASAQWTTGMQESMKTLTADFGRDIKKASEEAGESISAGARSLEGPLSDLITKLQETMDSSASNIRDLHTSGARELHESMTEIKRSMSEIHSVGAKEMSEMMSTLQNQMNESTKKFSEAFDRTRGALDSSVVKFSDTVGQTTKVIEKVSAAAKEVDNLMKGFQALDKSVRNTSESLEKSIENYGGILDDMKMVNSKAAETVGELKDSIGGMVEIWTDTSELWKAYAERFEGSEEEFRSVVQALEQGLGHYTDKVHAFTKELDGFFSGALEKLSSALGEMNEVVTDLSDTLEKRGR